MANANFYLSVEKIQEFRLYLRNEERADNTIEKYVRDIMQFAGFLNGEPITKDAAVEWKTTLTQTLKTASVNSMIAAVNSFCAFVDLGIKIKLLKTQRTVFLPPDRELTKADYEKLLTSAKARGKERLYHVMQTICSTGIRVNELRFITVEAVHVGQAEVKNKGKTRVVFVPNDLRKLLLRYAKERKISTDTVFITRTGNPVERTNIWGEMKKLCEAAGVAAAKVFPHNLRRLFAVTFYRKERDMAKLADILGHSDVNTTRIYVMETGREYCKVINNLGLVRLNM